MHCCVQVDLTEKRAGHLYECCIFVDKFLVIRHACLNQKMAKRSASEEFRDVLETFVKIEERRKAEAPSQNQQAPSSGRVNTSSSTPASAAQTSGAGNGQTQQRPPKRKRASNLVLCSDDEDDDDDGYGSEYSSGSEYGGARTVVKSEKIQADTAAASLKQLIESEKLLQYDLSSESAMTDDGRFRAVIRSLFTVEDELCTGIENLRGSLKFRGSSESVMVPNVRASIQMERLQEGVYEVRVAVNDVVHFVASEVTKADACNSAIAGVLQKLKVIRAVWVQLLHFFDTKVRSVDDIMESFHLLRLANITSVRRCRVIFECAVHLI